jgi:hypothetical protein
MMRPLTRAILALLAVSLSGCVRYEYEHEVWLEVDGSGSLYVTGRPALWAAFKGVGRPEDPEKTISHEALRRLFESSGLRVRRVLRTRRSGQTYYFVSADFKDVNALGGTPAFPDLTLALKREGQELRFEGAWTPPQQIPQVDDADRVGLMAVRLHLPSKVYEHKNAFAGVERGNILTWRQDVAQGLAGHPLEVGARMDRRSILLTTVALFGEALLAAVAFVALLVYLAYRRGRKLLAQEARSARPPE